MNAWVLARRNLRIFFRDRAGVFFSLLSPLILVGLYALFLGNLQVQNLKENYPNAAEGVVEAYIDGWVFAGIIMITTLTTGLAALSVFVEDASSGRFKDFLVSPIRRSSLILGYMISSFVVALSMSLLVLAVSLGYTAIRGNAIMSTTDLLLTVGYVAISSATFSALSGFIVTFLKSNGAFSSLSTIVGTIIGFLAGAYIPTGALPSGVVNIINALPFAQAAMLLRQPFTAEPLDALTQGQPEAHAMLSEFYGMTMSVGDFTITNWFALAALGAVFLVFLLLAALRLARRIR